nr:TRAP transporter small permease [uncultured Dethiosulfovibrio sp.]
MEEKRSRPFFNKAINLLSWLLEHGGMFFLVLMTLLLNYTVVTRYFFSYTPGWGESGALLCMVWFGFLSLALGVRDDQHIAITILDRFLSDKAARRLAFFKIIAIFLFGFFMFKEGYALTKIGLLNQLPGIYISSAFLYVVVPVSGFALCVYSLHQFFDLLREER